MKLITNWRRATVGDIEADALLEKATKMHVLSFNMFGGKAGSIEGTNSDRIKKFFEHHMENKVPVVFHNGITYDIPLVEKLLGMDLRPLMVIDTLSLSWYLNTERKVHGLDSFFEDYGIAKPKIDDWENLSYEEYKNRCEEDVKINVALWEDLKERLCDLYYLVKEQIDKGNVDGKRMSSDEVCYIDQFKQSSTVDDYVDRILTFLMFKADCARLKEKTRWKVDVPGLDNLIEDLSVKISAAQVELESVMPPVPQYAKRKRPAKPFLQSGGLSASGKNWEILRQKLQSRVVDEHGNALVVVVDEDNVKVLTGYEPPNINGHQQIKDFLFSKGWKPLNFKFVKDETAMQAWVDSGFKPQLKPKPRSIPQVSIEGDEGKELCPSVIQLAEKVPEIMAYAKYTTIKHRLDMCKGWKENLREGGYLCARVGGYTNTIREMHRELVNIPSLKKPLGKEIRSQLIADRNQILMGSDLSGLEDRWKHHFMLPYDPDYVATMMADDYDAHLLTALSANMITQEEYDKYKAGDKQAHVANARAIGKSTNYASVYGSGADTLSRTSGMSVSEAKIAIEGYWKLNWSVKAIAEDQCVIKDDRGGSWLINPINGFAYSLRSDKDRFSTLCQGTGSWSFDMWCDIVLDSMEKKFGVKRLTGQYHDEFIISFKDTEDNKEAMKDITNNAIEQVNETYSLRRKLGCDIQFGKCYAEIH